MNVQITGENAIETEPTYYIDNTLVPEKDGNRVLGPLNIPALLQKKEMFDGLVERMVPDSQAYAYPFRVFEKGEQRFAQVDMDALMHRLEIEASGEEVREIQDDADIQVVTGELNHIKRIDGYRLSKPLEAVVFSAKGPLVHERGSAAYTLPSMVAKEGYDINAFGGNDEEVTGNLASSIRTYWRILQAIPKEERSMEETMQLTYMNCLVGHDAPYMTEDELPDTNEDERIGFLEIAEIPGFKLRKPIEIELYKKWKEVYAVHRPPFQRKRNLFGYGKDEEAAIKDITGELTKRWKEYEKMHFEEKAVEFQIKRRYFLSLMTPESGQ